MSANVSIKTEYSLLKIGLLLFTVITGSFLLSGCSEKEPVIKIASNVWPGYELLYLAKDLNYLTDSEVRLVEVPSATMCIQSLAAGTVEAAMLTLDEVLTARAEGLEMKIVAVLDISMGADVVIARPEIKSLKELKGKKIGVEQSAVGAVMLNALLEKSQLSLSDINIVYLTVNQHMQAYQDKKVDALVTFEPVRTQLIKSGARQIFDSSQIPGRIIDVLAVLPHVLNKSPDNLKKIIRGHFKARNYFLTNKNDAAVFLSKRLQLAPAEVAASYDGLLLPDLKENHYWMGGEHSRLEKSAADLKKIMDRAKLLKNDVSVKNLVSDAYL